MKNLKRKSIITSLCAAVLLSCAGQAQGMWKKAMLTTGAAGATVLGKWYLYNPIKKRIKNRDSLASAEWQKFSNQLLDVDESNPIKKAYVKLLGRNKVYTNDPEGYLKYNNWGAYADINGGIHVHNRFLPNPHSPLATYLASHEITHGLNDRINLYWNLLCSFEIFNKKYGKFAKKINPKMYNRAIALHQKLLIKAIINAESNADAGAIKKMHKINRYDAIDSILKFRMPDYLILIHKLTPKHPAIRKFYEPLYNNEIYKAYPRGAITGLEELIKKNPKDKKLWKIKWLNIWFSTALISSTHPGHFLYVPKFKPTQKGYDQKTKKDDL